MDFLWDAITEWLKELLVGGITSNLSGMFDSVNQKVAEISGQVGMTPQGWNGSIYNMIHNLSETVIVPIAGVILAFVMTLELIQIITDKNNFHEIETAVFFKWIFKTACAILIVTNTWNIVMGVFDVAQGVVNQASGVTKRPDQSKNEGHVQSHQEAACLLRERGASRRAAFLSAQRACGDQHSGHVHGHPHAAVFPAGDVREERPAAGKNTPQHDTGVFPAAPAAAL